MRPATLADVARRRNAGEDLPGLLVGFLDTFYGQVRLGTAQTAIDEQPDDVSCRREHALLGAIGEHLARRWHLSVPDWTSHPSRFLSEPYFTSPLEDLKALMIAESPLAFRRRLIFTEAEPLRRARMPVGP
ncbi:MAG: hypothetical protein NW205_10270 [Hyphomicrobiaceae bacterium]|nr:hypothetical protein [Hyphomicrobiaceae bacterium]